MTNEICECGHNKENHNGNFPNDFCRDIKCPCKKFKPKYGIRRYLTQKDMKALDTQSQERTEEEAVAGQPEPRQSIVNPDTRKGRVS